MATMSSKWVLRKPDVSGRSSLHFVLCTLLHVLLTRLITTCVQMASLFHIWIIPYMHRRRRS